LPEVTKSPALLRLSDPLSVAHLINKVI